MLAMVVNDDARCLVPRGAPDSIASMLAPTGKYRQFEISVMQNHSGIRQHLLLPVSVLSGEAPQTELDFTQRWKEGISHEQIVSRFADVEGVGDAVLRYVDGVGRVRGP